MIVIERNGKTTVLTGWRAWLAGAAVVIGITALLFVIAFLLLGVAVTVGAVLIIVVPVILVVALLASLFQSPKAR